MSFQWSEWRRAARVCEFGRLWPAAIAHLCVKRMKSHCAYLKCCLAVIYVCVTAGCATVSSPNEPTASSTQNSPWLDPEASPNWDDMATAQRIAYCAWLPVLILGKAFVEGHSN